MRLCNKAVALRVVEKGHDYLNVLQKAVGVSDAGVMIASVVQMMYDKGV